MAKLQEFEILDESSTLSEDGFTLGNVRLLGKVSKKKRTYPDQVLSESIPKFEAQPVYTDHDYKVLTGGNRKYVERVGILRNVHLDEGGLRTDFVLNPKHFLAESIKWDFLHNSKQLGLSFLGEGNTINGIVQGIEKVVTVDLVCNPATSTTLREDEGEDGDLSHHEMSALCLEHAEMIADHHARLDKVEADHKALREEYDGSRKKMQESLGDDFEDRLSSVCDEIDELKKPKPRSQFLTPPVKPASPFDSKAFAKNLTRTRPVLER